MNLCGTRRAFCSCISKHRKFDGQVALGYAVWYGLGRVWIEGLRTDSLYIGSTGVRVSQLLAGVSFVVGGAFLIYFRFFRKNDPQKLFVNRVAARAAAEEQKKED